MCNTPASGMCENAATSAGTSPRDVEEGSSTNEEMHQVLEDLQHAPCQEVVCIGNVALFAGTSRRDVEEGRSMNKEERISFWRICNMHHVSKWCAFGKVALPAGTSR